MRSASSPERGSRDGANAGNGCGNSALAQGLLRSTDMGIWKLFIGTQPEKADRHAQTMLPPASHHPGYTETWGALALQGHSPDDDAPETWRSEEFSGVHNLTPTDLINSIGRAEGPIAWAFQEGSELPGHPDTEPDAILETKG